MEKFYFFFVWIKNLPDRRKYDAAEEMPWVAEQDKPEEDENAKEPEEDDPETVNQTKPTEQEEPAKNGGRVVIRIRPEEEEPKKEDSCTPKRNDDIFKHCFVRF